MKNRCPSCVKTSLNFIKTPQSCWFDPSSRVCGQWCAKNQTLEHSQLCRINLCPRAFWKIQKFHVALYQPIYYYAPLWMIVHLLSFIMSILSRFCWNAEVVICKAISNWSISCCYCHLLPETVKGLLTACSMEWSDMSGGGGNMRSHLSADRNRPSLKCKVCRWSWRECTSFILLLHMAKLLPVGRLRRQDWVPMTPGGVFISQLFSRSVPTFSHGIITQNWNQILFQDRIYVWP